MPLPPRLFVDGRPREAAGAQGWRLGTFHPVPHAEQGRRLAVVCPAGRIGGCPAADDELEVGEGGGRRPCTADGEMEVRRGRRTTRWDGAMEAAR